MQTPPLPLPLMGGEWLRIASQMGRERLRIASQMGGEWPRASLMSCKGHRRLPINLRNCAFWGASGWHGACPYSG